MSTNFVQPGDHISLDASPYDVEPGQGVVIGNGPLFGIASGAATVNEPVVIATTGCFVLDKVVSDVVAAGDKLYYDKTVFAATVSATGTVLIGVAIDASGNGQTTVKCRLSGAWGAP